MDLDSHRGITLILFDCHVRDAACLLIDDTLSFDDLNLCYLRDVPVTTFIRNSNVVEFSLTIKTKVLTEEVRS